MFKVEFIDILFFFHNAKLAKQPSEEKKKDTYPQWNYSSNKSRFIFSPLVCQSASPFKGLPVLISHPVPSSSVFTKIEKIV